MIQMDISGHSHVPLPQNIVFHLGSFSMIFWILNFQDHFEPLNNVFFFSTVSKICKRKMLGKIKSVFLIYTFPTSYFVPQTDIVCKIYALGKLTYKLPPSGPTNLLAFHLLGLAFWFFSHVKNAFGASF
jgi:hypothetical protein